MRDGGYYTDWNFPYKIVDSYLKTVSKLPISIVELGYLSDSTTDSYGPFYHLNKETLLFARKILNKKQKIFAMVNSKEIKNSKQLISLISEKSKLIDGIRFAIDPKKVKQFLKILKPARSKFKKISFNINLMYLSKWYTDLNFSNKLIRSLIGNVDTVSIVDSYGSMLPNQISNFLKKIKTNKIKFGCHFHNNCGLALASTLAAIDNGCEVADSTFLGMGRGAGNAETELLLALKSPENSKLSGFEINNLIEKLEPLKTRLKWGSSFSYAFSAREGYSQSKMMDLIQKRRLDPSIAVKALMNSDTNINRVKFEKLESLKIPSNKVPLLIGGGPSFNEYGQLLLKNLNNKIPVILSGSKALINFLNLNLKIKNPVILLLSGNELKKISISGKQNTLFKSQIYGVIAEKVFLPKKINFKFNKIVKSNSVAINPLLLAGLALLKLKIKKLNLAFFDGDSNNEKGKIVMEETQNSVKYLISKGLKINTLTKKLFKG